MRVLVAGASGRLGSLLAQKFHGQGLSVLATGTEDTLNTTVTTPLDITDFHAVRRVVNDFKPDIVINSAAWTDVDGCTRDPEKAIRINSFGAQNLANVAFECGAWILHMSSNEVFSGKTQTPYHEYDVTQAINPYGYSKWLAERAVMAVNPRHMIVRTAWLFAHGGKNFIQSVLGAVRAGKPLRVVTDESANPTYATDLAEALTQLVQLQRAGIYHLVNQGYASRWEFARYLLDASGFQDVPIEKITLAEFGRPSTPPEFSPLNNTIAASCGIQLRSWQAAVDAFLEYEKVHG